MKLAFRPPLAARGAKSLALTVAVCAMASWLYADTAHAAISRSQPLEVRILLDNSGSMFPGYRPDSGQKKSALGVKFFREYPEFRQWLSDFVKLQEQLNVKTVSMAAFTSNTSFRPRQDILAIQAPVPPTQIDVGSALDKVTGYGRNTFLAESLDEHTKNFEGLVWLITDNIVETGEGTPDEGVEAFFRGLNDQPKYRSVHLFKLPFKDPDKGLKSQLAIYGILVSPQEVPDAGYFDAKLRNDFRRVRRPGAGASQALFPGQEHLKLKDLSVDALVLKIPKLEVEIHGQSGFFRERQNVQLNLPSTIRSKLTQHSVVEGQYTLAVIADFRPDGKANKEFGIKPIPSEFFTAFSGRIGRAIPPTGSLNLSAEIPSNSTLSLAPSGRWAWIKMAAFGLRVEFLSTVKMTFKGINVRLERERMAGIFGVDEASKVFDFQDIQSIPVKPARTPVTFVLETGSRRSVLLLILLLVLGLPLGYAAWFLQRKANYRVTVGTNPPNVVGLHRLGRYRIHAPPHTLGSLMRSLDGSHKLIPDPDVPEIRSASATRPGSYSVSLPSGDSLILTIEALDANQRGGTAAPVGGNVRRPSVAPPPTPTSAVAKPPHKSGSSAPKRPTPKKPRPPMRRPGR